MEILPHYHDAMEILYILKGRGTFFLGEEKKEALEGDILFIYPGQIHAFFVQTLPVHLHFVSIVMNLSALKSQDACTEDDLLLDALLSHTQSIHLPEECPECRKALAQLLQEFLSQWKKKPLDSPHHFLEKAFFMKLFYLLAQWNCFVPAPGTGQVGNPVKKALDYMQENYDRKITTADLAKLTGFTEGYFCSRFKQSTHCTPVEYLNKIRIQHAKLLLASQNLSVEQVMEQSGFSNFSYFGKVFKKYAGCSPSAFRKNEKSC